MTALIADIQPLLKSRISRVAVSQTQKYTDQFIDEVVYRLIEALLSESSNDRFITEEHEPVTNEHALALAQAVMKANKIITPVDRPSRFDFDSALVKIGRDLQQLFDKKLIDPMELAVFREAHATMKEDEKDRRLAAKDKFISKNIECIDYLGDQIKIRDKANYDLTNENVTLRRELTAMKNSKKTGLAGVLKKLSEDVKRRAR